MNTLLESEQRSTAPETSILLGRTPRPSAVDRIAMRVAVRLLIWSTRPVGDDRDERVQRHELASQLAQRERVWEQRRLLNPVI
ncbi:hypothetical protein [Microbacterium invictum]|uniref:Uncharacterized protein n=1 Tax=Microbacterium invictum TaxID=515415 RepID=A0AA40VKZ8_9MICO|nr:MULTISPECIES: hypothetical protein [Microbacterium]MBB4138931.1 hypothetical protein [Microbacterium invictum]